MLAALLYLYSYCIHLMKKKVDFLVMGSGLAGLSFALKVAETFNLDTTLIHPIKTKDLNQKAPRPLNSSFNLNKILKKLGFQLSDVGTGLQILRQQIDNSKVFTS